MKNVVILKCISQSYQVYLVTGGINGGTTTEILNHGASAWVYSGALPSASNWMAGATLNNKLIVIGRRWWKLYLAGKIIFLRW